MVVLILFIVYNNVFFVQILLFAAIFFTYNFQYLDHLIDY